MTNKTLQTYHITWVTWNSRVSERMIEYEAVIRSSRINKGLQPLVPPTILSIQDEKDITKYIADITQNDRLRILAYNICEDHVHLILVCNDIERDNIVKKLKGISTQLYKQAHNINGEFHLWAQKYNYTEIVNEKQLFQVIQYIHYNREKHLLPENRALQPLVQKMLTPVDEAFDINNK